MNPSSLGAGARAPGSRAQCFSHLVQSTWGIDYRIEPDDADAFDASLDLMQFASLRLVRMAGDTPFVAHRRGPGARERVSLLLQNEGRCTVTDHHGASVQLVAGDACLLPSEHGLMIARTTAFRQTVVDVPIADLAHSMARWRAVADSARHCDRKRVGAVNDLLRFAFEHCGHLDRDCCARLAATLIQLIDAMLDEPLAAGAPSAAAQSRVVTFHRQRIERYVGEHLRDPELSVERIAHGLGLSTRYIHNLFAADGKGVMHWVMTQRLSACQREISTRGARSISEVAYAWGFNSPAHFSRAFKKQFGMCPSAA